MNGDGLAGAQAVAALRDALVVGFGSGGLSARIAKHRQHLNSQPSSPRTNGGTHGQQRRTSIAAAATETPRGMRLSMHTDAAGFLTPRAPSTPASRCSSRRMSASSAAGDMLDSFFRAVIEGDCELVLELLSKGVPVDAADSDGNTALIFAAEGEPQIVDALLRAGCQVNHQNTEGLSALMCSIDCARARRGQSRPVPSHPTYRALPDGPLHARAPTHR